ncbi:23017_t:CDS:2, partial [Gigaspora rosea]
RKKAFKMFKKQMQDVRDENKMLKRKLADKNDLKENESDSSKSDCDTDKPRSKRRLYKCKLNGTLKNSDNEFGNHAESASSSIGEAKNK